MAIGFSSLRQDISRAFSGHDRIGLDYGSSSDVEFMPNIVSIIIPLSLVAIIFFQMIRSKKG